MANIDKSKSTDDESKSIKEILEGCGGWDKVNSSVETDMLKNCCCEATRPLSVKERVEIELDKLMSKIHGLVDFLYSKKLIEANLTPEMISLLEAQLDVMRRYASILQTRLAIWDNNPKSFYHEVRS